MYGPSVTEFEFGEARVCIEHLQHPPRTRVTIACDDLSGHEGHVRIMHKTLPEKALFLKWDDPIISSVSHPGHYDHFVASFDGHPEIRGSL